MPGTHAMDRITYSIIDLQNQAMGKASLLHCSGTTDWSGQQCAAGDLSVTAEMVGMGLLELHGSTMGREGPSRSAAWMGVVMAMVVHDAPES